MAKRRKFRSLKLGCLTCLILFVILSQVVSSCVTLSMSDKKVAAFFEEEDVKPESEFYKVDGYRMHFKVIDGQKSATVVFVHGTPGAWDAFIDYFKDSTLYNVANIISVDRPGFGKSSFGKPVASLERQSEFISKILERYPAPRVLVGHSLGGPLVARMAMDYPKLVEGIIMLAPAIAPELEPNEDWFRVPMRWPIIEGIFPKVIRVSNEELIFLKEELELMLPLWKSITVPSVVIQGESDKLVAPGNGSFADSMLVNAPHEIIMLANQNHFLPWNESELVKATILKMIVSLKTKN
jgi:pimeloyl-ACP methyl ester carboxylesterase